MNLLDAATLIFTIGMPLFLFVGADSTPATLPSTESYILAACASTGAAFVALAPTPRVRYAAILTGLFAFCIHELAAALKDLDGWREQIEQRVWPFNYFNSSLPDWLVYVDMAWRALVFAIWVPLLAVPNKWIRRMANRSYLVWWCFSTFAHLQTLSSQHVFINLMFAVLLHAYVDAVQPSDTPAYLFGQCATCCPISVSVDAVESGNAAPSTTKTTPKKVPTKAPPSRVPTKAPPPAVKVPAK